MKNVLPQSLRRHCNALLLLAGLWALDSGPWTLSASQFTAQWFFSETPFSSPAVRQVWVTPLWIVTSNGTNIVIGSQRYPKPTTSGTLTISNLFSGGYRVEYVGQFTPVIFTNVFPSSITTDALVNAKDYISAAIPVNGTTVAYSQAAADLRFLKTNVGDYVLLGTNVVFQTNAAGKLTISSTGSGSGSSTLTLTNNNTGAGVILGQGLGTNISGPFFNTNGTKIMDFGADAFLTGGLPAARFYHAGANLSSNYIWMMDIGNPLGAPYDTGDLLRIPFGIARLGYAGQIAANLAWDPTIQWNVVSTNRVASMIEWGQEGLSLLVSPIGTTVWDGSNPDVRLRMRVTPAGNIIMGSTATTTNKLQIDTSTFRQLTVSDDASAQPMIRSRSSTLALRALRLDAYRLLFHTGDETESAGVEHMRLDEQGNLGINTTTPASKLHLTGNARIDSSLLPPLVINTNFLVVNTDGNVGIGLTTPGSLLPNAWATNAMDRSLEINTAGAGASAGLFLRRPAGITGLDMWNDGQTTGGSFLDDRFDNIASAMTFRMRTAGTPVNAMTILGSGQVGFGTTTPAGKVDIATSSVRRLRIDEDASAQLRISAVSSTAVLRALKLEAQNLLFFTGDSALTNGTQAMKITDTALVGIGTMTTPASKLEVAGSLLATGITNSSLTASRLQLTDANKGEISAAASGAVPVNADGSATTAAQLGTGLSGAAFNGVAATNLLDSNLKYPTNSVSDVTLIDLAKPYAHTNHTANFTISGFANVDTTATNYQFATRCFTNNSSGAKTITLPASWQDLGNRGNPVYNTNIGVLSVWVIQNWSTNYVWAGK